MSAAFAGYATRGAETVTARISASATIAAEVAPRILREREYNRHSPGNQRALNIHPPRRNDCLAKLEGWRGVHPQNNRVRLARIAPRVGRAALKVEAVARTKLVPLSFERDVQHAMQHVKELLAIVRIRIAAARSRSD